MMPGPRIRPGTYLVALPDGVEAVTGRGRTFLAGAATRQWIERLTPLLDGSHSHDRIVEMCSPERRPVVEKLLGALADAGVLDEQASDDPGDPASPEYAAELDYLRHFGADADWAFARYRTMSVVVLGVAPGVCDVLDALRRTGLRDARGVANPEDTADYPAAIAGADVVVHVACSSAGREIDSMEQCCLRAATPLVQLVFDGASAWWQRPGCGVQWSDVRARLAGLRPGYAPGTDHDWANEPLREIATNEVALSVFRFLNHVDDEQTAPRVVEWTPAELARAERPVRPHPFGIPVRPESDDEFADRMTSTAAGPAVTGQWFSEQAMTLMDPRVGIFGEIEHGALPQVPLTVATCTVADPAGLRDAAAGLVTVLGAELDIGSARQRVAMRAMAAYAAALLDPRRLVDVSPAFAATAADDPRAAVRELRAGAADGRVQALDILQRRVVHLDARRVFPALTGSSAPAGCPVGTGVALTWNAALVDGLLQHCEQLALDRVAAGEIAPRRVIAPLGTGHERADRLAGLLRALPDAAELYDVTARDGVPALLCVLGGMPVAVGCGTDYPSALHRCALEALRVAQLDGNRLSCGPTDDQRAGAPEPFPSCPVRGVEDLARALRVARGRPVVTPLDHDPSVAGVLPAILRVVLDDR